MWQRFLGATVMCSCSVGLGVPAETRIHCASNVDCPSGLVCQTGNSLCVDKAALDSTGPSVLSASGTSSQQVAVVFNEAMDPTSVSNPADYAVVPGLAVSAAGVSADSQTVTLLTAPQVAGQVYVVTNSQARDRAGNLVVATASAATFRGFGDAPDATPPNLLSPLPGSVVILQPPLTFSWSAPHGASDYEFQLATAPDFSPDTIVLDVHLAVASLSLPDADQGLALPSLPVTYYWRVRADVTGESLSASYPHSSFDGLDDVIRVYCPSTVATCSDGDNVGNLSKPMQTIMGGLGAANTRRISRVEVAGRGGAAAYLETINLAAGISLFGGYDATFSSATPHTETHVQSSDIATVNASDMGQESTVFDGFDVDPSSDVRNESYGIYISNVGALTISNCTVNVAHGILLSVGVLIVGSGGPGVGDGPLISKCVIQAGSAQDYGGAYSHGLEVVGSAATIRDNIIAAGAVATSTSGFGDYYSVGIKTANSRSIFDRNTISAGDVSMDPASGTGRKSEGVDLDNGTDIFTNNVIRAGHAVNERSTTIFANEDVPGGGSTIIANNTLIVPSPSGSTLSQGIYIGTSSVIANNLIVAEPCSVSCAAVNLVKEIGGGHAPSCFLHNTLVNRPGDTGFYVDNAGVSYATAADIETHLTGESIPASGTVVLGADMTTLGFASPGYRLTSTTSTSIAFDGADTSLATCGLDGAQSCGGVGVDRDGNVRTCPTPVTACFSRGAYEY